MDYLTVALILIGIGAFLLVAEILVPTGGILVVAALLFFALGVGTILYYGSMIEGSSPSRGWPWGCRRPGSWPSPRGSGCRWTRCSTSRPRRPPWPTAAALKGRTGKTVSPLRPSGTVEFDGVRVDAMTEGTMLDAGVWVRCVEVRRGQVIVRRIEEPPDVAGIDPDRAAPRSRSPPARRTR